MRYKLIVNQPFQSVSHVLGATFLFLKAMDPGLKRLEESWLFIPNGIAIRDRFNNNDIPIGIEIPPKNVDSDDGGFFQVDSHWYKPDDSLSRSELEDFLQVVNDHYGADLFAVQKTPIGYGFYKVVPDCSD